MYIIPFAEGTWTGVFVHCKTTFWLIRKRTTFESANKKDILQNRISNTDWIRSAIAQVTQIISFVLPAKWLPLLRFHFCCSWLYWITRLLWQRIFMYGLQVNLNGKGKNIKANSRKLCVRSDNQIKEFQSLGCHKIDGTKLLSEKYMWLSSPKLMWYVFQIALAKRVRYVFRYIYFRASIYYFRVPCFHETNRRYKYSRDCLWKNWSNCFSQESTMNKR